MQQSESGSYLTAATELLDVWMVIPAALADPTLWTLPACSAQGGGGDGRVQAVPVVTVTTATAHQQAAGVATAHATFTRQRHCRQTRRFRVRRTCDAITDPAGGGCGGGYLLLNALYTAGVCQSSPAALRPPPHKESGSSAHN